jgi:hypothetical protein
MSVAARGPVEADDKDDVHRTRAYGLERYLIGLIPFAAILLVLGLVAAQVSPHRSYPQMSVFVGMMLAMASFGFIVFACWRRFTAPARPQLVLKPQGIDQRLSHGRILHIPWDEVRDVISVDHRMWTIAGMYRTTLDVPAVVVSPAFYARVMPEVPWLRRPLNFGHFAEERDGTVRILFRQDYLGTRAEELRQAIETRWRAFSRHPNAKLPPSEASRRRAEAWRRWVGRLLVPSILVLCTLGFAYLVWDSARSWAEISEGRRAGYLGELLDKGGVMARLADGRMARLYRRDVSRADVPQCDLETARNAKAFWPPVLVTAATCTARLTLPSRAQALAVFRLVTETQTVEYQLNKFREESWLLPAPPPSPEEADALLCRLGHCRPDAAKR